MKNLGQKIERVDNATNEIMDKIRDIFNDIDLVYTYNDEFATLSMEGKLDDEIYSIIHNKLKELI
jgi:hypothetical protein